MKLKLEVAAPTVGGGASITALEVDVPADMTDDQIEDTVLRALDVRQIALTVQEAWSREMFPEAWAESDAMQKKIREAEEAAREQPRPHLRRLDD